MHYQNGGKKQYSINFLLTTSICSSNREMAREIRSSLDREKGKKINIRWCQKELQTTFKGQFIFLKMVACTYNRVYYFASNAQYVNDNNKIVMRTLRVKGTKAHHTWWFSSKARRKCFQWY